MSREAFEAWIKLDSTLSVERDGDGYRDMDVYVMWRAWQAAQADAYERAAKVCDSDVVWIADIQQWIAMTKKDVSAKSCYACADAIRALAKEAT